MKRLIFVLGMLLVVGLALASNSGKHNFEITVMLDPSLTSVPQKVYLHILTESEHSILDSALIDDRHKTITLSGRVPYQKNVILTFSKTNLDAEVLVTPGDKIKLTLSEEDAEYFHCIKEVKGSKAHSEYVQFMNYIKNYNIRKTRLQDTQSITKIDSISRVSISDSLQAQQQHYIDFMLKMSKSKYPFIVWYANIILRKLLPQEEAKRLLNNSIRRFPAYLGFNQLRPGYVAPKESARGTAVREKIWNIDSKRKKIAPQLVFGGKYVLVDFWASWCQPCLKEIPNIVAAKRKFGDHLEVCAITLDKISTPWKRAINEKKFGNGIHHYQGIDKRGNQYKDIAALGFETIPQNYLLDREGKIIAINIKGNELIKKLEELTNK